MAPKSIWKQIVLLPLAGIVLAIFLMLGYLLLLFIEHAYSINFQDSYIKISAWFIALFYAAYFLNALRLFMLYSLSKKEMLKEAMRCFRLWAKSFFLALKTFVQKHRSLIIRIAATLVVFLLLGITGYFLLAANISAVADFLYGKNQFNAAWQDCIEDAECILVEKEGTCCNDIISINEDYNASYVEYVETNWKKEDLIFRFNKKVPYCSLCWQKSLSEYESGCANNKCVATRLRNLSEPIYEYPPKVLQIY